MRKIVGIFLFLGLLATTAFADTIYLKNGMKVTGKLIEETGYSFKIMVNGNPQLFYVNEVDKVVKGEEPSETVAPPAGEQPPDEKAALILKLLELNGAKAYIEKTFSDIETQIPEREWEAYRDALDVNEVLKRIVPIYEKYYSVEELKELVKFYSSPVGAKHVGMTATLMRETMTEVGKYFEEKGNAKPQTK